MFYIISQYFEQNSAPTNHALSYIKGFSELGIKAEWVFIMPYGDYAKCSLQYDGIKIRYLWKEKYARNKIVKHLYMHYSYARFYFSLKHGDIVLLLGGYSFLHGLVRRKGLRVFHERTEHPQAVSLTKYRYFNKHYLADCARTEGLFVISQALKKYFENVGVDPLKVHVINMVVDNNRFKDIKKERINEPYIAYCGKASNKKDGVDDLIKAFAIVVKEKPEYKLFIIGEPPDKESDNNELIKRLALEDKIIFTGIVSADKIPQLLTNATILALARPDSLQAKYGFPTKLGEYLLTANPVVVTRVGDIPIFLQHGVSALMSESQNVKDFANNIIWAINHPEDAVKIGNRGKKVAEVEFNYLIETKKMCRIIFEKNDII